VANTAVPRGEIASVRRNFTWTSCDENIAERAASSRRSVRISRLSKLSGTTGDSEADQPTHGIFSSSAAITPA